MIRISMPARISIIILACVSPFFFPSIITVVLAFAAALIFPPFAILLGMLTDLLYEPTNYWPIASIVGTLLCVMAIFVRSFVKTRIM